MSAALGSVRVRAAASMALLAALLVAAAAAGAGGVSDPDSAAPPLQINAVAPAGIGLGKELNVSVNLTGGPAADAQEHERNYTLKAWLTGEDIEGASPLVGTPFNQNSTNGSFTVTVKAPPSKASMTLVLEAVSRGANGSSESARKELSMKAVNPITITVVLDNRGDVVARNVSLSYYLDDSFIGDRTVAEVPASNKTNVTFDHAPPDLAPGRHVVKVILDAKGQLVEFEEGNNVKEQEFFVHQTPDNTQPYFIAFLGIWLVGMVIVASIARRKKKEK
jgi:hypothetical protein